MDVSAHRKKAIDLGLIAVDLDNNKKYEEAVHKYTEASEIMIYVIKYEQNQSVKTTLYNKVSEWMGRAKKLKSGIQKPAEPTPVSGSGSEGGKKGESTKDEDKLTGAISQAIVTEKPNVKWDDVCGLVQAKAALQEAVILPNKFPQFFTDKIKPWRGILLYGPPGTGKSYLAKATATECNSMFFSISSSDLVSKWLGESEKLVKILFEMARKNKPAIVFIDEIDSLCGKRKEDENDSTRRIKTEFLVQLQGVGTNMDGVLVLGATNTPWELDPAVRRRFEKRIFISLPEKEARKQMFIKNVGKEKTEMTDQDYELLAEKTDGFSASDVGVMTKEALMQPIRKCQNAKKFRMEPDGFYYPTTPSDPQGINMTLYECKNPEMVKKPNVLMEDFMYAFTKCKKTVGKADLEAQENWTKEYGSEGS